MLLWKVLSKIFCHVDNYVITSENLFSLLYQASNDGTQMAKFNSYQYAVNSLRINNNYYFINSRISCVLHKLAVPDEQ